MVSGTTSNAIQELLGNQAAGPN